MSGTSAHRPPPDDLTRAALGRAARRSGPACLDAETLAAYYERSLDADAMARAEAHVAECLDCQKALVALAKSEPEPAAPVAGRRLWFPWRLAWAAPVLVAGLAVAVWYMQPPGREPRQEAAVASRAIAEQRATAAEAEGVSTEEAKAPEPAAAPAATHPRAADEPASGAAAAGPPAEARAAPEKTEQETAERRAVTGLATSLTQAAADTAATLVAAPGGRIVWRLGPAGAIARSDDGGTTWRTLATVDGEPLAGAAPSVTVCWAVGRGGAVWRTVDGEQWEQLATPVGAALVAVESTGADQAIVTADDGRRWETVDGGRTWFERGDGRIFR